MAYVGRVYTSLCNVWLNQSLMASPLVAGYGDRFYQQKSIPKPEEGLKWPHVYWTGGVVSERTYEGKPTRIMTQTSRYLVRCVRRMSNGANESVFDDDLHHLRNAITGIDETKVFRSNGLQIGEIYQSRYVIPYSVSFTDGDVSIMEMGMQIEVLHR
jgi:hypothetical protein